MFYDSNTSKDSNCMRVDGTEAQNTSSPWARYGCDPSSELIDAMFQRYTEKFENPDVLLVTGDVVGHKISLHREEATEESY